jgi:phosphatidate cytidylyltransferase
LLRWRLLFGAGLIAALVGLVRMDAITHPAGAWLFPLAIVVGVLAAQEVVSLLAHGGHRPSATLIYAGTLAVLASNAIPLFFVAEASPLARLAWPLVAYTLVVLAALLCEICRYRQPGTAIVNVGLTMFGVAYVGLLLSFALQLRVLGGRDEGLVALVSLIVVVKTGDTAAYTFGRLFGRHKMAPLISPGKTLEGAAGAIVFASLAAWLCFTLLPRWMDSPIAEPAWGPWVFGPLVGLAGLLGDLAESLFKRDMGAKDSSTWLPGFGGVLDLVDAILFAAPVAFLCWLLLAMV